MAKISGVVFYTGPSELDGSPIVGIATFGTANQKTGPIVQTWILRTDKHPIDALNDGSDSAICGSCPLRGLIRPVSERERPGKFGGDTTNKGRSCYVLVQNAPAGIYKSFHGGKYPILSDSHSRYMMGLGLRYGSYGDPVAIPISYWDKLAGYCTGRAEPGYTHQWRDKRFSAWKTRVMASTHSVAENDLASSHGWRTFRTIGNISEISVGEIICPASSEGGYTANCATCGACNGRRSQSDSRKSIAIVAHGGAGKYNGVVLVNEKAV